MRQRHTLASLSELCFVCALVFLVSLTNGNIEDDEANCTPQHVHIAYGDSLDQIVVMWATKERCTTELEFGASPWHLTDKVKGNSSEFWEQNVHGLHNLHRVKLIGLKENRTYFYRPLSNHIGSGPFYFKIHPSNLTSSPKFLVFGDLGVHTHTIPSLVEEALRGQYTALLHVGDFAYNLKDEDGQVGDQFMELIQPVAAFLPYMTAPGNHEIDSDTFTHYNHRFSMPGSPWPMTVDKMWYSFNVGPVHFISYSTEVFFTLGQSKVSDQYEWLVDDLQKAVREREERPWIIAFGHRPMYCSANDGDDCTKNNSLVRAGLEELFFHYGVDIILEAHEHNYERLYPMFRGVVASTDYVDPLAPVHIISGAAGSKHGVDHFQRPPKPVWSAVREENRSLHSYGQLHVFNATHVYWEQRSVHDNGTLLDSLWIIQHNHDMFHMDNLPHNISQQMEETPGQGILEDLINREDMKESEEQLKHRDFTQRIVIGASFGVLFAILLLAAVLSRMCRRRRYTSVRRWEAMDFDYGKKLFTPGKDDDNDLEQDYEVDIGDSNVPTKKLLNNN